MSNHFILFAVATVRLQAVTATVEGNDASVGVELSPPGQGTAISITVFLESTDGDASKCTSIGQVIYSILLV